MVEVSKHGDEVLKVPVEKAGQLLGDSVGKLANNADELAKIAHKEMTVKAIMNVLQVGGSDAIDKLKKFERFGRRKIDDVVDDLATISTDAAKMDPKALAGYKQLIGELSALGNKAKGAAHHLQVIRHLQEVKGYKILNIESLETINAFGTKLANRRRYDVVVEINGVITKIECKSWNFNNVEELTKRYLKANVKEAKGVAKDADELADVVVEGQQLFSDLLSYAQNGNKGFKWFFDEATTDGGQLFIKTIQNQLINDQGLRKALKDILKKNDKELDDWIKTDLGNLKDFVSVLSGK